MPPRRTGLGRIEEAAAWRATGGSQGQEENMRCHVCGGEMYPILTDLPFKLGPKKIVILKDLPVLQCARCSEFMLEDPVMERVDAMLGKVEEDVQLKILEYAA
jgi:YgiT-type zinc finger domain-containing protein